MPSLGPYRALPPDASGLGWIEERGDDATVFVRERGSALAGVAAIVPLAIFARLLLDPLERLSAIGWSVAIVLALGVIALWPTSREQLRIDARGLRWRDRLVGLRARAPLASLEVRVHGDARHSVLSIGDGRASWRVAGGDVAAIETLAQAVTAAIGRARSTALRDARSTAP